MQQREIQFFWPLTEQTRLDLDFTPSEEWIAEWRKKQYQPININGSIFVSNGGTGTTSWSLPVTDSFVVKPNEKNVGKWEISHKMFVYRPTKPNAIIRFMAKHLLGFKWHDEI
jgi:hypothetical protein